MRDYLNRLIDGLQAKFPPNRLAVLLTPILFAPAAGWASQQIATHLPGVTLTPDVTTGIFVGGFVAACGAAYKWLDGWQRQEDDYLFARRIKNRDRPEPLWDSKVDGAEEFEPPARTVAEVVSERIQEELARPADETPAEVERKRQGFPPEG